MAWFVHWKKEDESVESSTSSGQFGRREIEDLLRIWNFFVQRLKFMFLCNLLSWTNLFIKHISMSLVDFIYWLGTD